ncbi:MAG TPA: TetR/AcrR family transcriptional regulator [Gammaproteobacteria bacterium]|nr:TetR/AcrR family transcriptional regulator [Gammaproteobacteria bacterium]
MPRTSDKRERLIRSADRLILSQGFKQTTLSDIAADSGVPLGNVYYYFKTKEDICKTIVDTRIEAMQALLEQCSQPDEPKARLLRFLDYPPTIKHDLSQDGCPIGTLCYELSRHERPLNESSQRLIHVLLDWSKAQFQAMGRPDAEAMALQFVSNLQGMSLIANALEDPNVIEQMVQRTRSWIESL